MAGTPGLMPAKLVNGAKIKLLKPVSTIKPTKPNRQLRQSISPNCKMATGELGI
jgi:hypothetical protein